MPNGVDDLDQLVRRVDEDRWLASRFAPSDVRARLIALYALNFELAHVAESVNTPAAGDLRLAWWREALSDIHAGQPPRAHPVLSAYARAHQTTPFAFEIIDAMLDARGKDLDPAPFAGMADLEAYVDASAGGLMRLAVRACGEEEGGFSPLLYSAAQAWGLTGLLRAEGAWRARGRILLPKDMASLDELRIRVTAAYATLRALPRPPASLAPALNYVTLTPLYLRALTRGEVRAPLFQRQLKLVLAAATGRL